MQVRPRERRAGPLQAVQAVLRACSLQEGRSPGDCVTTMGRALGRGTGDPAQQMASSLGVGWQLRKGVDIDLGPGWSPGRWYHDQVDRAWG